MKLFTGQELISQIIPISDPIQDIPGRVSLATVELVFEAKSVPPLGYQSYFIESKSTNSSEYSKISTDKNDFIKSKEYNINVNSNNRLNIKSNINDLHFTQSFHYYKSAEGNNGKSLNRSSGAYIFRPKKKLPENLKSENDIKIIKGKN